MDNNQEFSNLASALGVSNSTTIPEDIKKEISEVTTEISTFEEKKNNLITKAKQISLVDKEFLRKETKELIDEGRTVLDILKKDIKIGTPSRHFEVFGDLFQSVIAGLRELRELNNDIIKTEMFNVEEEPKPKTNLNVTLTGSELLKMIKLAKEGSQLNAVPTEAKVENAEKTEKEGKNDEN